MPAATGWGYSKDFPRPASTTFQQRWYQRTQPGQPGHPNEIHKSRVTIDNGSPPKQNKKDLNVLRAEFKLVLEALGGVFISCSQSNLSKKVLECLHQADVNIIQSWGADHFTETLFPELENAGIEISHVPQPEIKAGLTAAHAAIAETGSLILTSGRERPLTASLLPAMHLAILNEKNILPNLKQALSLEEIQAASSTVLISGPSRTADIEMTLTVGVHGPGQLFVFCLEE
jgi:L-lactate utilization protein LutC